jgi:multisubunit Na+/H+ antiporter MnhB subunit
MPDVTMLVYLLMGFMILGSLVAIETADLLSAVICVGAVGFALGVIDLLLCAPEVALTLGVVEVLTLVVLIRMIRTRRDTYHATSRDTLAIGFVVGGLAVVLTLACVFALGGLPAFGQPRMEMAMAYLAAGLDANRMTNYVTSILLDFRVYDTLGACAVIFAGVTGAYAVLRKKGRRT